MFYCNNELCIRSAVHISLLYVHIIVWNITGVRNNP